MRVLIVEDDPELAGLVRDGLRAQRIDPTLATTFADGRERAALGSYDVIILDVRLPGGTGFDLCGDLRRRG
ncbi:MAG TPA: response regulator, partial [Gemmatimonadales bacterium]|nr:response regulator [Gemmatimonadales bacterium]